MRASDTVQTFFDEVKVPVRYTIGQPGQGFIYQMQQFQEERLWAGAGTLMGCDRIINATIDYTRERKVFGKPLLDNQVVHFRLAELKSEVEALRSLVYRACEDYLAGKDVTMLASMAKLKAGRLRREVSDACLQYWGGAGYLWDSPVARAYRDGRLGSIGGGADEVMLQIIAKLMGNMPSSVILRSRDRVPQMRGERVTVQFTQEHDEIRRTLRAIIDKDINPHVDQWEEDGIFPAHEVFKKLGDAGLLGINKPVEFGGMGLDYSYAMVMAEELGHIHCGSVPMAIGVQTDMATPALARYGSDELRQEFLAPSIAGDYVACLGVSEVGAGSDVASLKTTRAPGRRRLRHQRRQDVDDQRHPGRLDVPARQHRRRRRCTRTSR